MKITVVFDLLMAPVSFLRGLRHEARLKAHLGISHVTLEFALRNERGNRVNDHDVQSAASDENLGNLQGLLSGIRLRNQQVVCVDADFAGVADVQCVFGINEGGQAVSLLGLGHDVQRQGGLAARFRAVDLDDASARNTSDAECIVETDGAGRDHLNIGRDLLAGRAS